MFPALAAVLREGASFEARLAALSRVAPDPELPVAIDLDAEIPPFSLLQARRLVEVVGAFRLGEEGMRNAIALAKASSREKVPTAPVRAVLPGPIAAAPGPARAEDDWQSF